MATMVQEASGELSVKKVHPFFTKAPVEASNPPQTDSQTDASPADIKPAKAQRKRRKTDLVVSEDGSAQKKKPRRSECGSSPTNADHDLKNQSNPSDEHPASDFPTPPLSDISTKPAEPLSLPTSNTISEGQPHPERPANVTPPKPTKVLKWDPKTGTLGSPPKPKPKNTPSRIVCVKYGRDDASRREIGDKITQILAGTVLFPLAPVQKRARASKQDRTGTSSGSNASKPTHPFFTGKPKAGQSASETPDAGQEKPLRPSKHSVFMSTPVSPRKPRKIFNIGKTPQFGIKSHGPKLPGSTHPLWPAKDMSHVRGLDSFTCATCLNGKAGPPKKSKGSIITIPSRESILDRFCVGLDLNTIRAKLPRNNDQFEPVPDELRTPERYFESGPKLQKRIKSQLQTYRQTIETDDQELDERADTKKQTHPAILKLYETLGTGLSAYDRSTCECQTWTQKYAPTVAGQVLQAGKEALLLKEWLHRLRVQSVDTGTVDTNTKGKSRESAPKKKRKKDKLDGFVVDSEEEANYMDEVSEDEADGASAGSGLLKKTVIRSGDMTTKGSKDQKRLTNAVVISGPHGSGKTATIYAIAKELDFEIFEINSSSRRSGKDLLDKVGDMTRNHLVQQHRADHATGSKGEDEAEVEDETIKDLNSGKQGMMTAFFKPKPTGPKKPGKKPTEKQTEAGKPVSARSQKQSLILLEEVDVLYEEDKQFWATLMGMISQSRRPFVMTCNDESLLPLQSLNLHGIFRFSPPPVDLAVDLCLLVAANEGHILDRSAVDALYKCRNNDLRATLTDLNYWCQIGVGDRRGGFDWFVLRWPKGCDLDENGDVIRVASGETYRDGMGWISRDPIVTGTDPLEAEEEVMRQSWDSWNKDLGDWCNSLDLQSWADATLDSTDDPKSRLGALTAYEEFCETLSGADSIACGGFGTGLLERLDTTLPEITAKGREDFILGRALLEAQTKTYSSAPHVDISTSLKSLARQGLLQADSLSGQDRSSQILGPIDEDRAVSMVGASLNQSAGQMTRMDLAIAFDPIAISEKAILSTYLDPSVFDRTLKLIVLDVAPWVRSIVEFDQRLMQERIKLSNLLSEGGKRKRMRTTRSAYSALEGGERRATRRERYFGDALNTEFVRRTAGKEWKQALAAATQPNETTESIPGSPPVSEEEV